MCSLCQATGRSDELTIVAGFSCSGVDEGTNAQTSASGPVYSNDQIADQLTDGYWNANSSVPRSFSVGVGGTISVNITALPTAAQTLARNALDLWADITGLNFSYTSGSGQIEFGDSDAYSAYSWSARSGSNTTFSYVNVGTGWIDYYGTGLNSYSFQTYIHEIGHALGLGHAGNYNGSATYGVDNHYANDSWQSSIMSYFSQSENTHINASFVYAVTPQVADVIAIRNLYGTSGNTRTGNTTYGDGANSGDLMQQISSMNSYISYTIVDDGGVDTLNFASDGGSQIIDLREEGISSVRGYTGNLIIARGTVVENATGGSGADTLIGNDADNSLNGGDGNDVLIGGGGRDTFSAGAGNDTVYYGLGDNFWLNGAARDVGGSGTDTLRVEDGSYFSTSGLSWYGFERFIGGNGNDMVRGNLDSLDYRLEGGAGNDTLTGAGGDDVLIGGGGQDSYSGGAGNDTIYYGAGDIMHDGNGRAIDVGGNGTDTLIGSFSTGGLSWYGIERFFGAEGNDTVTGNSNSVDYYLSGGAGNDRLIGSGGDDTLIGGTGRDFFSGRGGNDSIYYASGDNFWDGGTAHDVGGSGTDTLYVENGSSFNTNGLSWYGFERFIGGNGNDSIRGNSNAIDYHLHGGSGNDFLAGAGGDDTLIGGAGGDRYSGGAGNDTIYYGAGDNLWDGNGRAQNVGGSGIDTLVGSFSTGGLSWYGIERFLGAEGNDTVTGNSGAVDYYLSGGLGNDRLSGAGGDDTLIGGAGTNILTGGGGGDTFHFNTTGFTDTITDFQDTIDLIEIDTGAGSFAALTIFDSGGDAHITYAGSTIILDSFNFTLLAADDFNFV